MAKLIPFKSKQITENGIGLRMWVTQNMYERGKRKHNNRATTLGRNRKQYVFDKQSGALIKTITHP